VSSTFFLFSSFFPFLFYAALVRGAGSAKTMENDDLSHWAQGLCPQGVEVSAANRLDTDQMGRESSFTSFGRFWGATPTVGPACADKIMGDAMQADSADGMYASAAFESASLPSHAVHGRPGEAVAATVLKWEQLLRDNPHDPMVR
jgi:hypothetical protein